MAPTSTPNPIISTSKSSDASLRAALHPLVLLTISDYITRHTLRQLAQPIVGVLLGQQNGREVTIEHAYDVRLLAPHSADNDSPHWHLHDAFFRDRLQQYKDVHKDPPLELVGWWTLSDPQAGPTAETMGIHETIMGAYNESALLLTFHPQQARPEASSSSTTEAATAPGVKLPLTIYESVYESTKAEEDANAMQIEGEESATGEKLELRLREMPYEIATGEAEMISVDFVARGGGNARAIDDTFADAHAGKQEKKDDAAKNEASKSVGEGEKKKSTTTEATQKSHLNSEEEELLGFLSTRANAIKMLQSRITQLRDRLHALPPSYLTSADTAPAAVPDATAADAPPHQLLRAILALTAKLALVAAQEPALLAAEATATRADTALIDLLATLGATTQRARELGGRFAARETGRRAAGGGFMGMATGGSGGGMGLDGDGAGPARGQEEIVNWTQGFRGDIDHPMGSRMEL